ncbi:hypothetical protein [Methanocaldococcus fervens]|uniref:DegT/DnrJ/EryC1/StrS aminotransferase n=1 Tax=Methanocaldococcus fervens (strain DSM 4213 / JCM 15782 / AG86) TaxID=573064 RepID=C7P630_METFA|nr:hypothetical protein [Methanocaldococcus fervens]ACV24012.1 hypothetical protein Mefer_0173 [Methanocaldococcus fervens AG86]
MILKHRRPNIYGLINKEGDKGEVEAIINDLLNREYTITFLPSGSSAVFLAMWIAKSYSDNIFIPNMGGWQGFLKFPKVLNLKTKMIETNLGIIDIEKLDNIKENSSIILTSLAGYLSPQPLKEIKKLCEEKEVLFIEDISGKIGGDCGYGDIVICSTGSPKILNCEYGGFLGISREVEDKLRNILNDFKIVAKTYKTINYFGLLKEELLNAKKTYKKYVTANKMIKKEIEKAYFKEDEGISIFIECDNPKEVSKKINNLIKLDNKKSITTICPNYDRILKNGVVFETKKIDVSELNKEVIDEIIAILSSIL